MSEYATQYAMPEDFDALSGALFAWCAERSILLRSQEALNVASAAIDLFLAGHRTQDQLLGALTAYEIN